MTLVRYKGERRQGYVKDNPRLRVPIETDDIGQIVISSKKAGGCLVQFSAGTRAIRLWVPRWELRRLVKQ